MKRLGENKENCLIAILFSKNAALYKKKMSEKPEEGKKKN